MTKKSSTKRSLIASILVLCMLFTSLVGTTFAWFTDSVSSYGNKIVSGSLKVDLELLDKKTNVWKSVKESHDPIFNYENWEPGFVDAKVLKVENEGTLSLKWKAKFISTSKLSKLADVIDVYVYAWGVLADDTNVGYPADRTLEGYTLVGTLAEFVNSIETTTYGTLLKEESAYLGIALKMQESAGNEYQNLDLGGTFDIQIVATQLANEEDSFGPDYDAGAEYDGEITNSDGLEAALQSGGDFILLDDVVLDTPTTIPEEAEVTIELNGNSLELEKPIVNNGTLVINGSATASSLWARRAAVTDTITSATGYAIENTGDLIINGGNFSGLGCIKSTGGTVTINGGNFNASSRWQDGIYQHTLKAQNTVVTINGGTFDATVNGQTNAVIGVAENAVVTIKGGEFINVAGELSAFDPYLFNYEKNGKLIIEDGFFYGGWRFNGDTATTDIYGGDFNVSYDGQSFNAASTHKLTVYGGVFAGKLATKLPDVVASGLTIYEHEDGDSYRVSNTLGSIDIAYTGTNAIWGECGAKATESFVLKIYSDYTYLGSTSLNNVGGIIDGDVYVTWNMLINAQSNTDEYWDMEWAIAPSLTQQPTRVVLCVDGYVVDDAPIVLNGPDNLNTIYAATVNAKGEILAYYTSLKDAMGKFNGRKVAIFRDVKEYISGFYGVTLMPAVEGGVTVTTTYDSWTDFDDVTVLAGVTVNIPLAYSGDSENVIEGTLNVGTGESGTYYHGYDAKTTIRNGGKVVVNGSTILRYNKENDAGIYIYGDGDNSTVEFDCAYYIGAYSGTFYAEDATVECGYFLLKNSYDNASYADVYMTLDNSTVTVAGTSDGQDSFIIDDQAWLTLVNGSKIDDVRDFNILDGANLHLSVDATSSIPAFDNKYVAKNGNSYYTSLQAAMNAVNDGDTIVVLSDITFNKDNYYNNGGWYDGLGYAGDKSFTLDLNGKTLTNDSYINDYLVWLKNVGEKENTITIKNGTLDATSSAYCALCTASSHDNTLTVNLENVKLYNNISNGSTVKIRAGSVLNVKDGTVITGKNSYLAVENWNATVNIYDGAELYMNGTSSYNGCLAGVGGNGTINVYGGYGVGVKGGFIAMTSGGTINVYGGEWIANTNGAVGDNSNLYVLTAQNNKYESGYAGASIINVYGGTLRGGMDAWILNSGLGEVAELNIYGGNFNANPAHYVADGYKACAADGNYIVVANNVTVVTTVDELKDAMKNKAEYIVLGNDITVTEDWDRRDYGSTADYATFTNSVVIDGMGHTLKFTGKVQDAGNYHCAFRFEAAAVVKNLTIDMSEVVYHYAWLRAISATSDLTVDNCTFIGPNDTAITTDNAIQMGDTNATAQIDATVTITNCTFINWRRGASDNENAKEVKKVVLSNNTFTNANVYVSAYESVEVTNNKCEDSLINITSYTNAANVKVTATENTLDTALENTIGSSSKVFSAVNVNAQDGFKVSAN